MGKKKPYKKRPSKITLHAIKVVYSTKKKAAERLPFYSVNEK